MLGAAVTATATSLTTVVMTTVLTPRARGTPKERGKDQGGRERREGWREVKSKH